MPDNRIGIVYRKKVYHINNNRINIKKDYFSIEECPFYYDNRKNRISTSINSIENVINFHEQYNMLISKK